MSDIVCTTQAKVDLYESSSSVFHGLLAEMRELSKKKPDAILNANKVAIINRILEDVKLLLKDEPESKYLDLLDDDQLPQNSDVVLVMVQFERGLGAFRRRYWVDRYNNKHWVTEEYLHDEEKHREMSDDEEYEDDDEELR